MATKQKVEKRFGYTLNYEGFINLLENFAPVWEAFTLMIGGLVGRTPESDALIERRDIFMRYAKPMYEGQLDTYERTIITGAMFMNDVSKYVSETLGIHDVTRVNEFFDRKCAEIESLSRSAWTEKMNEIGEARARFSVAVAPKHVDLREVVKAYNEVISILIPTVISLKKEAKDREDVERARLKKEKADLELSEKKEKDAREQRERMKRLHSVGEKALSQLSA